MSEQEQNRSGYHSEFSPFFNYFVNKAAMHIRKRFFALFMKNFGQHRPVLDVGVTSEAMAPEANFFEDFYPDKSQITAVGVEDASSLEKKYPGLKFVQIEPNQKLPFADKQFEVVFSNAVIEHVTGQDSRIFFMNEILRVGKNIFLTTPNKYFPIEPHTGTPLLHFLCPQLFYYLLDRKIISKFYNSKNLDLLTYQDLKEIGERSQQPYEIIPMRLLGFISNYVLIIRARN